MKYTLEYFFWDIRALVSTILVLIFFCYIRLVDSFLKQFLEYILTRKIELRVEIENLELDIFNGTLEIEGIVIYHPTVEEDPRWHYEYLAYAKSIVLKFDTLQTIYAFFYSRCSLLYVNEIVVNVIDLYVEGYDETIKDSEGNVSKDKVLNLELLGGDPATHRKRKKLPTQAELKLKEELNGQQNKESLTMQNLRDIQLDQHHLENSKQSCQEGIISDLNVTSPPRAPVTNIINEKEGNHSSETLELLSSDRNHMRKSWARSALSIGKKLSSKINKLNEEVHQEGLLATVKSKTVQAIATTVNTVDLVYKHAKKSIGISYHSKINHLHEKLRGGEPVPLYDDLYVQVKLVQLLDIEITLYQTLPPSLRQLEKKALRIPEITLNSVRKGWRPSSCKEENVDPSSASSTAATTMSTSNSTTPISTSINPSAPTSTPMSSTIATSSTAAIVIHPSSVQDTPQHHSETSKQDNINANLRDSNENPSIDALDSTSDVDDNCNFRDVEGNEINEDKDYLHSSNASISNLGVQATTTKFGIPTGSTSVLSTKGHEQTTNENDPVASPTLANKGSNWSTFKALLEVILYKVGTQAKSLQDKINNQILAENYEGIPVIVVAYYFERIILHKILKDNAGRLLQDMVKELGSGFIPSLPEEGDDDQYYDFHSHMMDVPFPSPPPAKSLIINPSAPPHGPVHYNSMTVSSAQSIEKPNKTCGIEESHHSETMNISLNDENDNSHCMHPLFGIRTTKKGGQKQVQNLKQEEDNSYVSEF